MRRLRSLLRIIRPFYGAGMLLYHLDQQGETHVLLGRRSTRPGIGLWSVPGGSYDAADGLISSKRDFKRTAIRETLEEIDVSVNDPTKIWTLALFFFHWELFCAESEDMKIPNYNWEFSQMRWIPIDDLPKDVLLFINPQVRKLKQRLRRLEMR